MSKLPHTDQSIFSVMSQMANEHQAINLSQGFPNFPVDKRLTDILQQVSKSSFHQYMPSAGYPPLLQKIAGQTRKVYGRNPNPETEILITAGATQGIFTTIQALINPGDEVIVLDPAYDCYDAPIILSHAKAVHIALTDDFSPDWNAISKAMGQKTRMIIINNPHNPSGKIWTESDFLQLETLLLQYPEVIVLSDEVYEFITFEKPHLSVNSREKLKDRSVIVSSFGKTFHITGWKIGYAIAPERLMAEIKKLHQYLVFSVNSPAQAAISAYMDAVDVGQIAGFYEQKKNLFQSLMRETRFELLPCEGSYFQIASYATISDEPDVDFAKRLVTDFGVAAIPVSVFYEDRRDLKKIRFCFAKENDFLSAAVFRLSAV